MNIAILGPQGSGKSTQAKLLADFLGLPMLDVGDFLRSLAKEGSAVGKKIKAAMARGELVDENLVIHLLSSELAKDKYKMGVVIDGAARTLVQAKELVGSVDKVFYLDLPDDVAKDRLAKRGRFDDTKDVIEKRLANYHKEVGPVLDYFKSIGVLETIDAQGSVDEVFNSIKSRIAR